ncbi:MAG: PAS domain S-box protein [Bacteroidetes bacterium]|nr:PAS domain S-box protein [Bacteroidota bacterium]
MIHKQLISALVVESPVQGEWALYDKVCRVTEKVSKASGYNEAIKIYEKEQPDLIITDIKLPDADGFELIHKIREKNKFARIIIASVFVESRYFLQAIEYGVKGFLIKPVSEEKLQKILQHISCEIQLERRASEQEARRKRIEKALKHSEEIMRAVSYAAEQFLKFNYGKQSIKNVLKRLGSATRVSRVYIFENQVNEDGKTFTSQQYEWVSEHIEPQIDNPALQNVSFEEDGFRRWYKVLGRGKPIYGHIEDFPDSEQNVLQAQKIISLIVVPIFVYNNWWGFIGFDQCMEKREWTEAEVSALMAAADIMGAAIHRKKVEVELLRLNNELENRINQRTKALQSEIQERAQMEMMLRESEEKYRQIFENANDGILLSVNGMVKFINPKLYEMTGYLPKESIGKPFVDFLHPDYREMVLDNHIRRLKGEKVEERYDIQFLDKEGDAKWFELKSNLITWEGDPAVLSFLTDITERKKTAEALKELNRNLENRVKEELEKIKTQQQLLIQKSKLESLGELAAGMAHEINQPLGSISMGLDNILDKLSKDELSKEYVERKFDSLFQDIARIRNIIEHIRIFSRDQQAEKIEKISINDVIINALSLITNQYRNHKISLSLQLADNDCYAEGNMYKLEQVILNLLSNAKHAIDEKAEKLNDLDYQKKILIKSLKKNSRIIITIEDNGTGIPEKIIGNIFDPFFTTKKAEMGTGLGLSIIYGIIKEMKGEIYPESKENEFTRMIVDIPEYKGKK